MILEIENGEIQMSGSILGGERHTANTEEKAILDMLDEVGEEDVFWDVGAYTGVWSVLASKNNPRNVCAFEPHPETFKRLVGNIHDNDAQVTPINKALSNRKGSMGLETETGFDTVNVLVVTEGDTTVDVETPKSAVEKGLCSYPTVMKIDVEGEELNLVRGLNDELVENCRVIYCEIHVHEDKGEKFKQAVIEELHSKGYEIKEMWRRKSGISGHIEMVKAFRR